jgi:hypothetical protein
MINGEREIDKAKVPVTNTINKNIILVVFVNTMVLFNIPYYKIWLYLKYE